MLGFYGTFFFFLYGLVMPPYFAVYDTHLFHLNMPESLPICVKC